MTPKLLSWQTKSLKGKNIFEIYVRDCNGKRDIWKFETVYDWSDFYSKNSDECNDDNYEIQIVMYDGHCIYSGLSGEGITFEELNGFFA